MKNLMKMVHGLPSTRIPQEVCENCFISKQPITSFSSFTSSRSTAILHFANLDVFGPFEVISLGGNNYFVSFVDEFSRKVWIYLLKAKSEAFSFFKSFKSMVEKQYGKFIKVLRIDGGGEFCSKEIEGFRKDNGILHETTTPYTLSTMVLLRGGIGLYRYRKKYAKREKLTT